MKLIGSSELARKKTKVIDKHVEWTKLSQRFPQRCVLTEDTIYALPMRLIDALEKWVPELLSKEDLQFEKALTKTGGMGFFLKEPFRYRLLPQDHFPLTKEQKEGFKEHDKMDEKIRKIRADVMRNQGCSNMNIKRYFKKIKQYQLRAEQRQRGYAGWLISNPDFQISRIEFLQNWSDEIKKQNEMPNFPMVLMVQELDQIPEDQREFYSAYMSLFRKWSLETLSTWLLPLPMQANPLKFSPYHQESLGESGINLFIPWYLLGDKDLNLHEIAADEKSDDQTKHLREWLDPNDQNNKKWGRGRFETMLEMYVYLIQGLYLRYPDQIKGNIRCIDEAYTEFQYGKPLSRMEIETRIDSIKKVRLELQRRRKICHKEVEQYFFPDA